MVRSEVPRRVLFNFLILPISVFALEILSLICLLKHVCCRDAYQNHFTVCTSKWNIIKKTGRWFVFIDLRENSTS